MTPAATMATRAFPEARLEGGESGISLGRDAPQFHLLLHVESPSTHAEENGSSGSWWIVS